MDGQRLVTMIIYSEHGRPYQNRVYAIHKVSGTWYMSRRMSRIDRNDITSIRASGSFNGALQDGVVIPVRMARASNTTYNFISEAE